MKKLLFYGYGNEGREYYNILKEMGYKDYFFGFCDKKAASLEENGEIQVYNPSVVENKDLVIAITVKLEESIKEIAEYLKSKEAKYIIIRSRKDFVENIPTLIGVDKVKFYRDYIAFFHVDRMDAYFEKAELETNLNDFWGINSEFYKMFCSLDLSNVIELACGRGRHVQKYIVNAQKITLVDILQKNIDICRDRYGSNSNVSFYVNDGYDLKDLNSEEYTSLFLLRRYGSF